MIEELWTEFLGEAKKIWTEKNYQTWILDIKPELMAGKALILNCRNDFVRDWVKARYLKDIMQIIQLLNPEITEFIVKVDSEMMSESESVFQKLDRIESKLDQLIELAKKQEETN